MDCIVYQIDEKRKTLIQKAAAGSKSAGQFVWQQELAFSNQYRKLIIPVNQLSSGIYFLKVEDPQFRRTITISKQ